MAGSWFLVIYLTANSGYMVSKESFSSLEECGAYFNENQNELKKLKNVSEIRCEEGSVVDSIKHQKI